VTRRLLEQRFTRWGVLALAAASMMACERPPAIPAATATVPTVVTVRAKDFAFDAPSEITGGTVTFQFLNDGPQLHHVQLIRLSDGKTLADLQAALKAPGPLPAWATEAGGPNAVDAGHELTTTMQVAPGDYAIICFVDTPDHVPHFTRGMTHALHVVAPPATATAATAAPADLTITLSDFKFDVSDSVSAGPHTIDVVVKEGQPHELVIFRLLPGKTVQDFMQWGETYQGDIPAVTLGGTAAAVPGIAQRITVDFAPGEYVLMCFVPDATDGKPHMMKGMVRTFTVS
jgi:hypothetical protein